MGPNAIRGCAAAAWPQVGSTKGPGRGGCDRSRRETFRKLRSVLGGGVRAAMQQTDFTLYSVWWRELQLAASTSVDVFLPNLILCRELGVRIHRNLDPDPE